MYMIAYATMTHWDADYVLYVDMRRMDSPCRLSECEWMIPGTYRDED